MRRHDYKMLQPEAVSLVLRALQELGVLTAIAPLH